MKYAVLAAVVAFAAGCTPLRCQTLAIDVYGIPGKPVPAGRVVIQCNGKTIVEAEGENVQAGK
jgi:hypothetical protein